MTASDAKSENWIFFYLDDYIFGVEDVPDFVQPGLSALNFLGPVGV